MVPLVLGGAESKPEYFCKDLKTGRIYPDGHAHSILARTGKLKNFLVVTNTTLYSDHPHTYIENCKFVGMIEDGILRLSGHHVYINTCCFFVPNCHNSMLKYEEVFNKWAQ